MYLASVQDFTSQHGRIASLHHAAECQAHLLSFLASVNSPADFLSAYVGFVYFDCSIQLLKGNHFRHSVPDAVAQIPCSTVVDSEHSLELTCAYALGGLAIQGDSKEPTLSEPSVCRGKSCQPTQRSGNGMTHYRNCTDHALRSMKCADHRTLGSKSFWATVAAPDSCGTAGHHQNALLTHRGQLLLS